MANVWNRVARCISAIKCRIWKCQQHFVKCGDEGTIRNLALIIPVTKYGRAGQHSAVEERICGPQSLEQFQ
jgi:hypothetical protein